MIPFGARVRAQDIEFDAFQSRPFDTKGSGSQYESKTNASGSEIGKDCGECKIF